MITKSVKEVKEKLLAGEVAAIPTETVYGLAALSNKESAVRRVFSLKSRPFFDPLITHIGDWPQLALPLLDKGLSRDQIFERQSHILLRERGLGRGGGLQVIELVEIDAPHRDQLTQGRRMRGGRRSARVAGRVRWLWTTELTSLG